ncbi:MAG: hypothetical protein JWR18_3334 [Segetibacter sp.]|jgi:hypothetical protein|nr:hypothetical protein [Segetibacter sp.]
MKKNLVIACVAILSLGSCKKKIDGVVESITNKSNQATTGQFVQFTIPKGEQYSDKSTYTTVNYQQLSFIVKFDSSAIYQTVSPANQTDINKLFGFSDNKSQHHEYSARFGWRWSNNALRLFSYIYNKSVMSCLELGTVAIGSENTCSIKVNKATYIFTLNGKETTMPRTSTTATAEGYKLFPYFGGDEMAPHTISVWIKEL